MSAASTPVKGALIFYEIKADGKKQPIEISFNMPGTIKKIREAIATQFDKPTSQVVLTKKNLNGADVVLQDRDATGKEIEFVRGRDYPCFRITENQEKKA